MSLLEDFGDVVEKAADVAGIAYALIGLAVKLVPSLKQSIAIVDGSEHAPALSEVLKGGNKSRQLLEDSRPSQP